MMIDVTQPFLTPRKWEQVSDAIYKAEERGGELNHVSDARIFSFLGDNDVAYAFVEHYERLPLDMKKVENCEYEETDFPTVEDKLYALGIVIAKYNGDEIALESFISECLGDEYLSIYKNMKKKNNSEEDTKKVSLKV